MNSILVLGPGCQKCHQLKANVDHAVQHLGLATAVEHVTDVRAIMEHDVLMTPAMLIDGKVAIVGRVPSVSELERMLLRYVESEATR